MLNRVVCYILLFLVLSQFSTYRPAGTYFFVEDSIRINVDLMMPSEGDVQVYHARIFSPVCEPDKCYNIELDIYWDLIGRFIRYDTVQGNPLTKLDHIPFTTSEYQKMQQILQNERSALADYPKKELTRQNTRISEIDGLTGATADEIRSSVIEGAAYSCYTLWHIVHGSAKDSIRLNTREILDVDLVNQLVNENDQKINYFLINSFDSLDFIQYKNAYLETIKQGKGYYNKKAISKLPDHLVSDVEVQSFFASYIEELDYFAQVSLLEKLSNTDLIPSLENAIIEVRDDRKSYKNDLIEEILNKE